MHGRRSVISRPDSEFQPHTLSRSPLYTCFSLAINSGQSMFFDFKMHTQVFGLCVLLDIAARHVILPA